MICKVWYKFADFLRNILPLFSHHHSSTRKLEKVFLRNVGTYAQNYSASQLIKTAIVRVIAVITCNLASFKMIPGNKMIKHVIFWHVFLDVRMKYLCIIQIFIAH